MAMQDAIELSSVLLQLNGFDSHGRVALEPIRAAEEVMLARKKTFNERKRNDPRLKPRHPPEKPNHGLAKSIGAGLIPVPAQELRPEALKKVRATSELSTAM